MGGGMLKLEPTEAENVLLPNPNFSETALDALAHELDSLARQSGAVEEYANREVLQRGLGLTKQECRLIAEAAVTLRHRRLTRSTHDEKNVGDCTNIHIAYPALVYGSLHLLRANAEGPIPNNGRKFLVAKGQNNTVLDADVAIRANGEIDASIKR
ncbi:MAG: hypothetical protein DMG13_16880, partial [Acidobacteria bacterium]